MKNLKIILLILLSPVLLLAQDYEFVVENSTMLNVYWNIFNAIAAMLNNSTYISLLRLAFLLGGFFVFVGTVFSAWEGANAKSLSPYAKYLFMGTALLTFVFSPKSNFTVTTNNIPSYCATSTTPTNATPFVVELPSVLAFTFATSNLIGRELTNLAESAFSTPSSVGNKSMKDSDGYLGALKQSIKLLTMDPNKVTMVDKKDSTGVSTGDIYDMSGALEKHFSKCIYEVANNKGLEGQKALTKFESSSNLETAISDFLNESFGEDPSLKSGNSYVTINGQTFTCSDNFNTNIKPMLDKFKTEFACSEKYKTLNGGALEILTGKKGVPVSELSSIAMQSGLINTLENSKRISGIGISGADYSTGKSKAEFNQSSMATGTYMAEMMPYIQMTMRAVLYGFFPFVFVVVLLPGGLKVLIQYAQTMLWIELWGPTAAVINMFVSMQAQEKLSSAYTKEGQILTNSIDMLTDASTIAGYGSYLYASVPALTWLILKGSGSMLGNVTGSISAGFGANLASKAVNMDAGDKKTVDNHNKAREEASLKAVSFGEAMHFESQIGGAQRAGKLNASMYNGIDSNTDVAEQTESSSQKTALLAKSLSGTNNNVAEVKASEQALSYDSLKNKLSQADIYTNGKLDYEKLKKFGTSEGGKQTVDLMKTNKGREELSKIFNLKGTEEEKNKELNKILSTIGATAEVSKTKQDDVSQKQTGQTNEDGSINTNNVTKISTGKGTAEAKQTESTIQEMVKLGILDKEGKVINQEKYKEYVNSEAGQAAMKTMYGSEEFKQSGMSEDAYRQAKAKEMAITSNVQTSANQIVQNGTSKKDQENSLAKTALTNIKSDKKVIESTGKGDVNKATDRLSESKSTAEIKDLYNFEKLKSLNPKMSNDDLAYAQAVTKAIEENASLNKGDVIDKETGKINENKLNEYKQDVDLNEKIAFDKKTGSSRATKDVSDKNNISVKDMTQKTETITNSKEITYAKNLEQKFKDLNTAGAKLGNSESLKTSEKLAEQDSNLTTKAKELKKQITSGEFKEGVKKEFYEKHIKEGMSKEDANTAANLDTYKYFASTYGILDKNLTKETFDSSIAAINEKEKKAISEIALKSGAITKQEFNSIKENESKKTSLINEINEAKSKIASFKDTSKNNPEIDNSMNIQNQERIALKKENELIELNKKDNIKDINTKISKFATDNKEKIADIKNEKMQSLASVGNLYQSTGGMRFNDDGSIEIADNIEHLDPNNLSQIDKDRIAQIDGTNSGHEWKGIGFNGMKQNIIENSAGTAVTNTKSATWGESYTASYGYDKMYLAGSTTKGNNDKNLAIATGILETAFEVGAAIKGQKSTKMFNAKYKEFEEKEAKKEAEKYN